MYIDDLIQVDMVHKKVVFKDETGDTEMSHLFVNGAKSYSYKIDGVETHQPHKHLVKSIRKRYSF